MDIKIRSDTGKNHGKRMTLPSGSRNLKLFASLAFMLALILSIPTGWAMESYFFEEGYKDAKWGMSMDEIKKAREGSLLLYNDEEGLVYHDVFEGIPTVVVYKFKEDKLNTVIVNYQLNLMNRDNYLDQYNRIERYLDNTYGNRTVCREATIKEACMRDFGSERLFENGLYMTTWKSDGSDALLIMNSHTFRVSLILQCACESL